MFMGKSTVPSKVLYGLIATFVVAAMLQTAPASAGDTVYYYYTDSLHSAVAVTDAHGNVLERTYYAPYGQVLNRDLRDGPGYTGHEEDPETGLVYMQQRYYCPECGRFLSVDPIGVDPTSGGNFNRYEYANDNPYRYTDPDGRETGSTLQAEWKLMGAKPNYTPDTAGKVIGGAALALVAAPVAIEAGFAALSNPGTATTIVNTVADAAAGNAIGGTSLSIGGGAIAAGAHAIATEASSATNGVKLGKQLASEAQMGEVLSGKGAVIAGGNSGKELRAASGLAENHGGSPSDWTKVTSSSYTAKDGQQFSTHAYQNQATGQVVEPKTKLEREH